MEGNGGGCVCVEGNGGGCVSVWRVMGKDVE